jgi:hypothetical protein
MLVQAVGILAVPPVGGPTRRLDIGHAIGSGAEDAEEGFRMHGARAYFGVVGLLENAALAIPEVHQLEDQVLEGGAQGPLPGLKFYFRFHGFS